MMMKNLKHDICFNNNYWVTHIWNTIFRKFMVNLFSFVRKMLYVQNVQCSLLNSNIYILYEYKNILLKIFLLRALFSLFFLSVQERLHICNIITYIKSKNIYILIKKIMCMRVSNYEINYLIKPEFLNFTYEHYRKLWLLDFHVLVAKGYVFNKIQRFCYKQNVRFKVFAKLKFHSMLYFFTLVDIHIVHQFSLLF